jgi:hypothetical protein
MKTNFAHFSTFLAIYKMASRQFGMDAPLKGVMPEFARGLDIEWQAFRQRPLSGNLFTTDRTNKKWPNANCQKLDSSLSRRYACWSDDVALWPKDQSGVWVIQCFTK